MEILQLANGVYVVTQPAGFLDRRTTPELEAALDRLLSEKSSHLVVDLSNVTEMSSAGLRVLINATKRARALAGGDVRLVAPGRRVVEVLDLAGLLSVIHVFPTREDAVASFQPAN